MKLLYTQYADTDEPVMLINKHIGMDDEDGEGIMGDKFQSELMFLDTQNKKRIKVFVCSPGGNVLDGMQIYNAILSTKTKVDTYNVGVAASIAGVICQAGRTRYMSDYSLLMMHNPFNPEKANAAPELEAFKNSIVKMLARKNPNTTEEAISDLMNNTTWMNATEAMEKGFCDCIEDSNDMNKPRATSINKENVKETWKNYANYFNSITINKSTTMKKVYNKLKLVDGADENQIVSSIEVIENRAIVAEQAKATIEGELATAKDELKTAQNKVTDLEKQLKEKQDKEDAEALKAKENAANLLIENAAKVGKIKNDADTLKTLKAQAVKDFEGTKALIEAMPVNKAGFNVVNKIESEDVKPYSMQTAMIEIALKNKQR